MKILIEDKVLSISSEYPSFLNLYGPENLQEEPDIPWVSTSPRDVLKIDLDSSVSASFLGKVEADYGKYQLLSQGVNILHISQSNPAIVTVSSPLELETDQLFIEGVEGMIELNSKGFDAQQLSETTFSIDVDSTSLSSYLSGGTASLLWDEGDLFFKEVRDYYQYFQGQETLLKQLWKDLVYQVDFSQLRIELVNETDIKESITFWDSSGFFTNGSQVVPLSDRMEVDLGSIVLLEESTSPHLRELSRSGGLIQVKTNDDLSLKGFSNGDIILFDEVQFQSETLPIHLKPFVISNLLTGTPSSFTLEGTEKIHVPLTGFSATDLGSISKVHQITEIMGNGTQTGEVTLSPHEGNSSVRKILKPVTAGIARTGFAFAFKNPKWAMGDSPTSWGGHSEIGDGIVFVKHGNVSEGHSCHVKMTHEDFQQLKQFAKRMKGDPFAAQILDDFGTPSLHSGFFFFPKLPEGQYFDASFMEVSFTLREFL